MLIEREGLGSSPIESNGFRHKGRIDGSDSLKADLVDEDMLDDEAFEEERLEKRERNVVRVAAVIIIIATYLIFGR